MRHRSFVLALSTLCPVLAAVACSDPERAAPDAPAADTAPETTAEVVGEPCPDALFGRTRCNGEGQIETCTGGAWTPDRCPGTTVCDAGACLPLLCTPHEGRCGLEREVCSELGTRWLAAPCTEGTCIDGACVATCEVGARRCEGASIIECGADFVEREVETCDVAAGAQCVGDRCLSECEVRGAKRGNLACDFWAADLPNDPSAIDNVFAFAFSNASPRPATVTITYPWGPVEEVGVPVGGIGTHALPVPRTLSQIARPGLGRQGFHITSDQPIAAFMFNPLERYDGDASNPVATNDASLLVPTTALGTRYIAMTWSDPGQFSRRPYVTVVGTRDGTEVVVTPTEAITFTHEPFVAPAGAATTFTLDAFETLTLEAPEITGVPSDLAGTRVESTNHPIAVFSGNRCARVPDVGRFCDHLETQLPPLETWGDTFVVVKFADRGGEHDYFRVIALEDDTAFVFDPPRPDAVAGLDAGKVWQFASQIDFTMTSSKPVLFAQFMASQSSTEPPGPFGVSEECPEGIGKTCQGDPSLVLAAPVEQWRSEHIFLVPDTYRHQFIDIAFAAGTTLTLDGAALATTTARTIGASDWRALSVPTSGGYRTLTSSAPVGVTVYGYDHNISYAFNAGLDFLPLRATPAPTP